MFTLQPARTRGVAGTGRFPYYLALCGYGVMACALAGLWLLYLSRQADLTQDATGRDFLAAYVGGRTLLAGQGDHLYDTAVQARLENAAIAPYGPTFLPNLYPPWNAVLMVPFALLLYGPAYWLWGLLNLALAAWTIRWLLALAGADRPVLLLAALGFAPLFHSLWQGQTSVIALLGLTGAVVMFRRGADRAAGLWLLLVLLKTQLIPLAGVALLVWRRPQAIVAFALGAGGLFGASLLGFGNWLAGLNPLIQTWLDIETRERYTVAMPTWRGLLNVLLGTNASLPAQGLEAVLVGVSLAGVGLLCWPRGRWGQAPPQVRFALAAILLLLASPHLYIHDLVVLLLPGFLLWQASSAALAARAEARSHALRWVLGWGPVVFYAMQFWHPPVAQIGAWYLVLLVAAALGAGIIGSRPPRSEAAPPVPIA